MDVCDQTDAAGADRRNQRTTIILVRHGETAWNREMIFRGWHDVPLNENGRRQAGLIARALRGRVIDAAYTSPLRRAAETGHIALADRGVGVRIHEGLKDFNYGRWTGKRESDAARQWPEEYAIWLSRPHDVRPPGGDTLTELSERAFPALEEIAAGHPGATVAVFSHRVVNKVLLIKALGLELRRFPYLLQDNGCLNELERRDGGYLVRYLNDTCHIKAGGVDLLSADF